MKNLRGEGMDFQLRRWTISFPVIKKILNDSLISYENGQ